MRSADSTNLRPSLAGQNVAIKEVRDKIGLMLLAETQGFEPWIQVLARMLP